MAAISAVLKLMGQISFKSGPITAIWLARIFFIVDTYIIIDLIFFVDSFTEPLLSFHLAFHNIVVSFNTACIYR